LARKGRTQDVFNTTTGIAEKTLLLLSKRRCKRLLTLRRQFSCLAQHTCY
jgi:hypothetical protein